MGISVSQKEEGQNVLLWLLSAFGANDSFLGNPPAVKLLNSSKFGGDCL